jgi:hypothetical protein
MGRLIPIDRGRSRERAGSELPECGQRGRLSIGAMVTIFTVVAVVMTAIAVLMGGTDWRGTLALAVLISVVALLKVALANFIFFTLVKADQQPDRRIKVVQPPPEPPGARKSPRVRQLPVSARSRRWSAGSMEEAAAPAAASAAGAISRRSPLRIALKRVPRTPS